MGLPFFVGCLSGRQPKTIVYLNDFVAPNFQFITISQTKSNIINKILK